eukprot:1480374-Pleurochrysis_carterae.AAC.1
MRALAAPLAARDLKGAAICLLSADTNPGPSSTLYWPSLRASQLGLPSRRAALYPQSHQLRFTGASKVRVAFGTCTTIASIALSLYPHSLTLVNSKQCTTWRCMCQRARTPRARSPRTRRRRRATARPTERSSRGVKTGDGPGGLESGRAGGGVKREHKRFSNAEV